MRVPRYITVSFFLYVLSVGDSMTLNRASSGLNVIPTNIDPSVTNLVLTFNLISYVANDSLSNLKQLAILKIGWNQISYVEDGTFDMLAKLTQLILAGNRILHIPGTFGKAERSLEKLGFYSAFAEASMKSFDLSRFPKLKYINIGSNDRPREQLGLHDMQLMRIYYANIETLFNLETLYLKENYLESIPDFFHLPLKYIDLRTNRLVCNASLCWIRLWKYVKSPMKVLATCSSPATLKGKSLMTIHPTTMECYKGNTVWRLNVRIGPLHVIISQ